MFLLRMYLWFYYIYFQTTSMLILVIFSFVYVYCAAFWSISPSCLWAGIWLGKWEVIDIWAKNTGNSYNTVWKLWDVSSRVFFGLSLLFVFAQLNFFCHSFSAGHLSGMKISVKVQSLQFQAGLSGECYAVVIYGTILMDCFLSLSCHCQYF